MELHIIGDNSGEIVVGVLAALPVRDIGLNAQQSVLYLSQGFILGDWNDVNGEHHSPIEVRQLRYQRIPDKRGIVLQIQYPAKARAQLHIVAVLLNAVRADIITEIMAFAHHFLEIEMKACFLAGTVEIMENLKTLRCAQLPAI